MDCGDKKISFLVRTRAQTGAQRSGSGLERRGKGAERMAVFYKKPSEQSGLCSDVSSVDKKDAAFKSVSKIQ